MRKSARHLPNEIVITWNTEDIKERDDKNILSQEDCREILDILKRSHDATVGINWDVIDNEIESFLNNKEEK